jgi:hypothetical protein
VTEHHHRADVGGCCSIATLLVQIWYHYEPDAMSYGQDVALQDAVAAVNEQSIQQTCVGTEGTTCWNSVRELT